MTTACDTRSSDGRDSNTWTVQRAPPAARALVVGEEERVHRWASGRLRQAGFEVHTTDDGLDAVQTAHRDPPDLIVLDHVVPGVDARYLLLQLRRDPRTAHIPILFLAPSATSVLTEACRELSVTLLVTGTGPRRPRLRLRQPPATTPWAVAAQDPANLSVSGRRSHDA